MVSPSDGGVVPYLSSDVLNAVSIVSIQRESAKPTMMSRLDYPSKTELKNAVLGSRW